MASEVDVCNLALARLGDTATVASISPPEGSAQAEYCARFYPVARDALLSMYTWSFAVRRTPLAHLLANHWGWSHAYAAPNDSLRILGVIPADAPNDAATQPYEVVSDGNNKQVVVTDLAHACVRYVVRETNAGVYPPVFVDALGWLLASHLAGPLLKGDAGAQMARVCYQSCLAVLAQARTLDANQSHVRQEHTPAWIAVR